MVTWDFHDFPGAFPVHVEEMIKNELIVLRWAANEGESPVKSGEQPGALDYQTTVTMTFEGLTDGRTLVSIAEEGWRETAQGLKASYGNCMGWSQMISAMKAWVEHGINLREGFYK